MATNSDIEWTDATWNPVTGCSNKPRLQELLCRKNGEPAEGDAASQLRKRV
jgi:hypothetical protein